MNIKIIGIILILLTISLIPTTSVGTATHEQDKNTLWLRGFVFVYKIENNTVYAYAIRLHFIQWTKSAGSFGTITFIDITFPDDYQLIQIGKLIYVIGISNGNITY
jgi:hypothetical protein